MRNRLSFTFLAVVFLAIVALASFVQAQSFTFSTIASVDEGSNDPLVIDSSGNFYDSSGGGENLGTIFEVSKSGTLTELYYFGDSTNDGDFPSPLTRDSAGNLYGTSTGGLYNVGIIFKVSPTGEFTNLHNVTDAEGDLDYDDNPLVLDSAGNIYGTEGGTTGMVWKLETSGTFSQLYQFCSLKNCADGASPNAPIRDSAGNIYGTTAYGGIGGTQNSFTGNGVVFKVTSSGVETVLHEFAGGTTDGLNPDTRLKQDNKGNLYGITYSGGKHGAGVLFKG